MHLDLEKKKGSVKKKIGGKHGAKKGRSARRRHLPPYE